MSHRSRTNALLLLEPEIKRLSSRQAVTPDLSPGLLDRMDTEAAAALIPL